MTPIEESTEMGPAKSKAHSTHGTPVRRSVGVIRKLKEFSRGSRALSVDSLVSDDWYENVTPLWLAARYGDLQLAQSCIDIGADVNLACGSLEMAPLHVAAYHHHTELMQLLLESGASTRVLDKWNYTPLMYVVIHHEPFTVNTLLRLLLQAGCDVNYGATLSNDNQPENYQSLDLPALCSGYTDSYVTHIREPMGPVSGTALHLAVQNPHLTNESLELLISAGADINKRNLKGQTPIMGAMLDTYYDYHRLVQSHAELLTELGARLELVDERGWTPLHYAAQRGSVGGLHLLLTHGADCNLLSTTEESALWLLLAQGWLEAAAFLLQNGCHVDQFLHGKTIHHINPSATLCRFGPIHPLEFAVSNRYFVLARLLVQVGCQVTEAVQLGECCVKNSQDSQVRDFYSFLSDHVMRRASVWSLSAACRRTVRAALQQGVLVKLESLGVPRAIRDYIAFNP